MPVYVPVWTWPWLSYWVGTWKPLYACKELLSPYCQVSFVCLSCELRWSWRSECDNVALSTNSKRYCHLDLYWRIITLRAPVRANIKPWRRPLKCNVYPCRISLIEFNFCLLNKLILKTGGLLLVMLVMQCYGLIPKRFPQKVPVCAVELEWRVISAFVERRGKASTTHQLYQPKKALKMPWKACWN